MKSRLWTNWATASAATSPPSSARWFSDGLDSGLGIHRDLRSHRFGLLCTLNRSLVHLGRILLRSPGRLSLVRAKPLLGVSRVGGLGFGGLGRVGLSFSGGLGGGLRLRGDLLSHGFGLLGTLNRSLVHLGRVLFGSHDLVTFDRAQPLLGLRLGGDGRGIGVGSLCHGVGLWLGVGLHLTELGGLGRLGLGLLFNLDGLWLVFGFIGLVFVFVFVGLAAFGLNRFLSGLDRLRFGVLFRTGCFRFVGFL